MSRAKFYALNKLECQKLQKASPKKTDYKGEIIMATKKVEYVCKYCGKREIKQANMGRPLPGKCPRKTGDKPHSWVVNRRFES